MRLDGVDEVGGDQFRGRHVDAQPDGWPVRELIVPGLHLPAAGFDDPAAEFTGQVGGLDEVDEAAGWQQAEVGVWPPDQRLDSGDLTGDQRDLGLVVQHE